MGLQRVGHDLVNEYQQYYLTDILRRKWRDSRDMYTEKSMWENTMAICKPRKKAEKKSTLPASLSGTSSLQTFEEISFYCCNLPVSGRTSLEVQWLRISLPVQETWVWSPGQEDPLEKETATLSSFLAWKIPWTEKPGGLQSMGSQKSQTLLSS